MKVPTRSPTAAPGAPECAFILQCIRLGAVEGRASAFAVDGPLDGLLLLDAVDYHGIAPLVHRAVEGSARLAAPPEVMHQLRDAYRRSAQRSLFLSAALIEILDALQAAGVAALPLKGPVLAEALYGDVALRPSSDLDILVRRPDVQAALRVLAQQGYELGPPLARLPVQALVARAIEVTLRHPRGAQVDLHWAVAPADYPFRFDPEILWRSVQPGRLCGRGVPALAPQALLLFLCVHGAKHLWSRLMWLGDVARLVPAIADWDAAQSLAAEARCTRPLLLGLLLAHDLLGAAVPAPVIERARAEPVVGAAARQAAGRLVRMPPDEPGSLELTRFNARLAERRRDKARHYLALLAPSDAELEFVHLPAALGWAHVPLRFARLSLKYAARLVRGR